MLSIGTDLFLENSLRIKFVDFGLAIFWPRPRMLLHQVHWETVTRTPGKPGVSRISANVENFGNSVQPWEKFLANKIVSVRSNICITQQGLCIKRTKSREFWVTVH